MNVIDTKPVRQRSARSRLAIVDCDIHPAPRSSRDLFPFLSARWRHHVETYGPTWRQGYQRGSTYPKGQPDAQRRDAWPPDGGRAGSNLDFMRKQYLDPYEVEFGILNPLSPSGQGFPNLDFSAAYCSAINDWLVAEWTEKDARLKASIVVPYEDGAAAAAEIRKRADDANFAQVLLLNRTAEPLGHRRYWPIYEAAQERDMPIGVHAFGYGGWPATGGGWPSYYIEEMVAHSQSCQATLISLVFEGVFERFPRLRILLVESGFAWLPALTWRMDKHWERLRDEVPHLTRRPSEYVRENVWFSTQPMEEPDQNAHLLDTIEWIGADRLLFASDYPHWDFDDPALAMNIGLPREQRDSILRHNGLKFFRRP